MGISAFLDGFPHLNSGQFVPHEMGERSGEFCLGDIPLADVIEDFFTAFAFWRLFQFGQDLIGQFVGGTGSGAVTGAFLTMIRDGLCGLEMGDLDRFALVQERGKSERFLGYARCREPRPRRSSTSFFPG